VLREGEVGAGDVWERIARKDDGISVIESYRLLTGYASKKRANF